MRHYNSKKGQGLPITKVIASIILILLLVTLAIMARIYLVKIGRWIHPYILQNEKAVNDTTGFIAFTKGARADVALRKPISIIVNSTQYNLTFDCVDTDCNKLNMSVMVEENSKYKPLDCGKGTNYVIFDNESLACCGHYFCDYAFVDENYAVHEVPYAVRKPGEEFILANKEAFVFWMPTTNEMYRVNFDEASSPFCRTGGASHRYYNFIVLKPDNKRVYCSGSKGDILRFENKFICCEKLPFRLYFVDKYKNGFKVKLDASRSSDKGSYLTLPS